LARSRYILFKLQSKWTEKQDHRARILFEQYPDIKKGYELSMMLRGIYQHCTDFKQAEDKLSHWFEKVEHYSFPSFLTEAHSISIHKE